VRFPRKLNALRAASIVAASLAILAAAPAGRADGNANAITISGAAWLAAEAAVAEFRRGNPDPELATRTIRIEEQPDRILLMVFREGWRGGALLVTVSRDGNRVLGAQWMR
jgi:hypothetical protein